MDRIADFDELIEKAAWVASKRDPVRVVLSGSEDESGLIALESSRGRGIVKPILVGDMEKTREILERMDADVSGYEFHDESDPVKKAELAASLIASGEGEILMKGHIPSATFLKPIFHQSRAVIGDSFISHVGVMYVRHERRFYLQSDGALNIAPDLEKKKGIVLNAIKVAKLLGIERPKVAMIAATEAVHPKMPDTIDAFEIALWAKENVPDADVEGPMALDIAVSREAAKIKHMDNAVAGRADILIGGDIEVGNVLYKGLRHFAHAEGAGIVMGASCPVLLVSRSDPPREKMNSLALGVMYACHMAGTCSE
jgi:phosphate butyryltransferase